MRMARLTTQRLFFGTAEITLSSWNRRCVVDSELPKPARGILITKICGFRCHVTGRQMPTSSTGITIEHPGAKLANATRLRSFVPGFALAIAAARVGLALA